MTSEYSEGPFYTPFLAEALFARFLALRKSKKGTLKDFRRKNDENLGLCFLFGSFFYKREKYLVIFDCILKFKTLHI